MAIKEIHAPEEIKKKQTPQELLDKLRGEIKATPEKETVKIPVDMKPRHEHTARNLASASKVSVDGFADVVLGPRPKKILPKAEESISKRLPEMEKLDEDYEKAKAPVKALNISSNAEAQKAAEDAIKKMDAATKVDSTTKLVSSFESAGNFEKATQGREALDYYQKTGSTAKMDAFLVDAYINHSDRFKKIAPDLFNKINEEVEKERAKTNMEDQKTARETSKVIDELRKFSSEEGEKRLEKLEERKE
ncbi:MAG: hypothetical protein ABIA67_05835 [Candidatus Margulisiibacteriota bacterium]